MSVIHLSGGERVVKVLRQAGVALLPAIALVFLVLAFPWRYFQGMVLPGPVSLLWKVWSVAWVVWFVWKFLRWKLEKYIITSQRLVVVRHLRPYDQLVEETPFSRILNIALEKKGVIHFMFGLGTVIVHVVGLPEPLRLNNIYKAGKIAEYLRKQNTFALQSNTDPLPKGLLADSEDQRLDIG